MRGAANVKALVGDVVDIAAREHLGERPLGRAVQSHAFLQRLLRPESKHNDHAPAWLKELRGAAFQWVLERGFPTAKDEAWKYTQVGPILEIPFEPAQAGARHRLHYLAERATEAYEGARAKAQRFLNAEHVDEIVFVRGTTEAINLVAQTYGMKNVGEGDEVLITAMEHHSNIVPWQMLCEQTGARLRVAPINDDGELLLDEFEQLIGPQTRLVAVTHVSNVLGTINPIRRIVELAHVRGARVLIDDAQAVPHLNVDVQALGCDFYVFSGHKMYGPTGIGVLYGRSELLEEMPPYQGGGDMILSVSFEKTVYNKPPYKFEAGTPNMAGAVGLGAAIDFLTGLGHEALTAHEEDVLAYGTRMLSAVPGLRLIGTAHAKASALSFVLDGVHPHDIGTILDREGVAIRVGHHCAQPLMSRLGVPATARASLGCYSTQQDIDALVAGLGQVRELFQ